MDYSADLTLSLSKAIGRFFFFNRDEAISIFRFIETEAAALRVAQL